MLAVRDELRPLARSPRSSIEYGSLFLTAMEDPGLVVLPTHRVVHGLHGFELDRFLPRLRERFAVEELRGGSPEQLRERLAAAGRTSPAFALLSGSRALLATLRPGQEAAVAGPSVLRRLDVAVLHTLILEELLGIDRSAQERQTNLRYVKDLAGAFEEARRQEVQVVFLLNPTGVTQLRAAAAYLVLLHTGVSARMRDLSERLTRVRSLQMGAYWVQFLVAVAIMSLPLTVYRDFVREHRYGLSNLTFAAWLGELGKGLAISAVLGGLAMMILHALVRRLPRTWWIWGATASVVFGAFFALIVPVVI